jgi:hypothetical protein
MRCGARNQCFCTQLARTRGLPTGALVGLDVRLGPAPGAPREPDSDELGCQGTFSAGRPQCGHSRKPDSSAWAVSHHQGLGLGNEATVAFRAGID